MAQSKPINPFYVALLPVGVLFALSACAYTVVTVRGLQPYAVAESPVADFLNRYGLVGLILQLLILAVLTVSAIASDDYWTRRFEKGRPEQPAEGETS